MESLIPKDFLALKKCTYLQSVILDEIQHSNFFHGVLDSKGFFGFEKNAHTFNW
jgi:hypothetical protein